MAERATAPPDAPKRAADRLPRVPEILFLLERKKAERKEMEDAEKYSLVPPQSGSAPLPSEVDPPITRDDFQQ